MSFMTCSIQLQWENGLENENKQLRKQLEK